MPTPSFCILVSQHSVQLIHGTINSFPGARLLKINYSNATELAVYSYEYKSYKW